MCGEFDEVSGIIDPVINFLAAGTLFLNSYDTLSYAKDNCEDDDDHDDDHDDYHHYYI